VGAGAKAVLNSYAMTKITPESRRGPSEQQPVILRKSFSTTLALSCFTLLDDYSAVLTIMLAKSPD
jgi:hypothetical protein